MSLGDRVAVMRSGRIVQIGPPMEVYDLPAERFVGGFLGSPPMNFLPARVRAAGELLVGEQALPGPPQLSSYADREVLVGIRAEAIDVTSSGSPGAGGLPGGAGHRGLAGPATGRAALLRPGDLPGPGPW